MEDDKGRLFSTDPAGIVVEWKVRLEGKVEFRLMQADEMRLLYAPF